MFPTTRGELLEIEAIEYDGDQARQIELEEEAAFERLTFTRPVVEPGEGA